MANTEIIEKIKQIVDGIVPKSDKIFREAFNKIYTNTLAEANTSIGLFRALNNILYTPLNKEETPAPLDFLKLKKEYEKWYMQIHFELLENFFTEITEDPNSKATEKINDINDLIDTIKNIQTFMPDNADSFGGLINYFGSKVNFLKNNKQPVRFDVTNYWPFESSKLKTLESILLRESLIEQNSSFEISFNYSKQNKIERTIWLGSQQELFALLYLIFNNSDYYLNERISVISWKLFTVKKIKENSGNTNRALTKFTNKIHKDPSFVYNEHSKIYDIIDELGI